MWVDGLVRDAPVRFRLDTGAAHCIVPLLDSAQRPTVTGVDSGVALSGTGLGDDEVVVPRLRLGDLLIEDVAATRSVAGSPLSPLLGMTALGRFRCEFRFSDHQLELDGRTGLDTGDWFDLTSALSRWCRSTSKRSLRWHAGTRGPGSVSSMSTSPIHTRICSSLLPHGSISGRRDRN